MKDKEKQNKEILKLDILDCAGIKLAYLDDMRISKSKPLSVMKNMLSIDCHKDYILEALGITKDSVVLSKAKYEMLVACSSYEGVMGKLQDEYVRGSKETAEKIYNYVERYIMDDSEVELIVKEWFIKQFGAKIKE